MLFEVILILNTTKKLSIQKRSKIKKKKKRDYRPCNIAYVKDVAINAIFLFSNFKAVQKWNTDMKHEEWSILV